MQTLKNNTANVELSEEDVALIVQGLRCKILQTEELIKESEIFGVQLSDLRKLLRKMWKIQDNFEALKLLFPLTCDVGSNS